MLGPRGPSLHAQVWSVLRAQALKDPELMRAYGTLPATSLDETEPESTAP